MHLARWLTAAALLAVIAAPLPACRKYIELPLDAGPDTSTAGTGGRGGTGGVTDTGPPVDTNGQPRLDGRVSDAPVDAPADAGEACGIKDQGCCPGNRCNGGCCNANVCVAAFDLCHGASASCTMNTCGSVCGGLREPCCVWANDGGTAHYCARELTVCVRTDAGATGRCETCGNTGEPCCDGNYCEPPNLRCVMGRCVSP
jgi:hypothetical protein